MKKLFTIIISSLLLLTMVFVSCEMEDFGTVAIKRGGSISTMVGRSNTASLAATESVA